MELWELRFKEYDPKPEDFPNNQDGFNDGLVLTHPEWIKQIHQKLS